MRIYNFAAGPATLPEEVLQQAQQEFLDYHNLGASITEISHRSIPFEEMAATTESDLRELLNIPKNYKILFLQGGARTQFAAIPLNLFHTNNKADYIDTGYWSRFAAQETEIYGKVNIAASSEKLNYTAIPKQKTWKLNPNAAYLYYTDNETIEGLEFPYIPESNQVPLVCDMSSNFLSRPFDISKFGIVFACAQKNIAPAGITMVIIREDLIADPIASCPRMLRYDIQTKFNSTFNTPPVFCWYMAGLMFKWLKKQGGLTAIAKINQKKAQKLYNTIDKSDFYINKIEPEFRSNMNVPFYLAKPELTDKFIQQAEQNGLANLKGHTLTGGLRASIYNAMPVAGVDALISFMQEFENNI